MDGRIFGNESIRRKEEFDRLIAKQLEETYNKYLKHPAEGLWVRDDLANLELLNKKKK